MGPISLVFFGIATALVAWALVRKRDACTLALALGLAASLGVGSLKPWSALPYLAAIDAVTCIVMLALWTQYTSMRAWTVGFIGLAKGGATWAQYLVDPVNLSWAYALALNAAFLAQVLIAGGWADAVGNWADRLFARVAPVRRSLLRNGAP